MAADIEIIKKPHKRETFTAEQIEEIAKCTMDPLYFIKKYLLIQHPLKGRVPFETYPYQEDIIEAFNSHRNTICLTGRQLGKTTCAAAFLLWKATFFKDTQILICANKMNQAQEIMDRIRFSYENMEKHNWLRAGVVEYNKGNITFDNGSSIVSRATTKDAGRGLSITLLYVDEFAFVPPRIADEFWTAISPVLATGGSCIITSTPNNDEDRFAKIWQGANIHENEKGEVIPNGEGINKFFPLLVPYFEHPDRDEKWAEDERQKLGEKKFLQEHACEFVSSDETLVDSMVLSNMTGKPYLFWFDDIKWYEEPTANHIYGIGWDPSLGTGNDNAAIEVYDFTEMKQVAEWKDPNTPVDKQVGILLKILYFLYQELYDDPDQEGEPEIYWSVENNTVGEAALMAIQYTGEEAFPGYFISERVGRGSRKGMNTNTRTKLNACSQFKRLIETGKIEINSKNLIRELKNFVASGGSYAAKYGEHDDLIMASLIVIRILQRIHNWDESLEDTLSTGIDVDQMVIEPLPPIL